MKFIITKHQANIEDDAIIPNTSITDDVIEIPEEKLNDGLINWAKKLKAKSESDKSVCKTLKLKTYNLYLLTNPKTDEN